MDHETIRKSVKARTKDIRRKTRESAATDAELITRQLDTVDLIVNGATVRQVAELFVRDMSDVTVDYHAGLALLIDKSIDRSIALREEITARQRSLVFANMPKARSGDRAAAQIVIAADGLLASIWGLRSLRIERPPRTGDPGIADAVGAYLEGLADSVKGKS